MKYLKAKILNWVVNSQLKGFTMNELMDNLTSEQKEEFAIKSRAYLEDKFWTNFDNLMTNLALNKMGQGAVNQDEMMFAKMVLWFNSTRRAKMKEFATYEKPNITPQKKW
jgi:hypothetical protein